MTEFEKLGLSAPVLKAIKELGFEKPSEIQERSIPLLIQEDRDFLGLAQTGTGKTAAFGLPLLDRIDPQNKDVQALILAPTRELGRQIADQLHLFCKYQEKINALAVYGGTNIVAQIKALRRPQQIIIATPGRLIDLIKRKSISLERLRFLILDEADEMLNMGFKEDLDVILQYTPEDKLVWLFSATMSREISRIVSQYMKNPLEVKLNKKNEVNANIEHQFAMVRQADKTEALTRFLDINPQMRGVVFCRTRRETQQLADDLVKKNYKADALHGDLSQHFRDKVMRRFKQHTLQLLIATDIAARGIDVNDLTHVFHFSLPDDLSYYTHRSGRTARAGKKGVSIAFINSREKGRLNRIMHALKIDMQRVSVPNGKDIAHKKTVNWCRDILNQSSEGLVDDKLLSKAVGLFEDLSKEELVQRLLANELEKMQFDGSKDLNVAATSKASKPFNGRGGGRRGGAHSSGGYRKKKRSNNSYGRKNQKPKNAR